MGAQSVARFTAAGHGGCPLLEVLEQEAEDRRHRRINRLRRESRLPSGKTWEIFEHDRMPLALRQQLGSWPRAGFVERGVNVLAFGLPGTGKTHALCALGHRLVEAGHSVLFAPAYRLVQELLAAKRDLDLPRQLRKLDNFDFLLLDTWATCPRAPRSPRELLARAWSAGAGPGDAPFTIDLDSTICETYGLAKEGARDHGYTGRRGYHPLLAVAAGTGDVLMARLREGRANTARGAAHFLRETVGRVRYAGARGQLTVRADSGFYTHAIVAACRRMDVRFSITIRQSASLRSLIEAIPEQDWTPIPYWMEGAADVAETSYTPFQSKPDAAPVRLIVRRVKPTPGSQLALFASYSYHGFITDREGEPWNWRPTIGATPRSRTPSETSSTAWG